MLKKKKSIPENIDETFQIKLKKTIPTIRPFLKPESNKAKKKSGYSKLQNLVDYRDYISGLNKKK